MYRHFAVVTVMLTATLAIFASGENAQQAEQANKAQKSAQAPKPEEKKPQLAMSAEAKRKNQSKSTSSSPATSFSSNFSAGYGVPMDQIGAEVQNMRGLDWSPDMFKGANIASNIPAGISPEVWKDLSPEQKEKARQIFGPSNQLSPEEQLKRQKEMVAAAAIRARK